jgi:general secretion pathway protein M
VIVRIIQRSGIESTIARFDAWWSVRSQRERVLFASMAALLGAVVLFYGILLPLQNMRAKAYADIRTYETINARIRAAGTLSPQRAQRSGGAAEVVNASAASLSVPVQVTTIPGGVRATIADAPYDAVMSWLADLSATSRLRVKRVEMKRQTAPGRISAVVDFTQ